MTLFGFIWLLIIFIAFVIKDIKPMIIVTIIGMIWQCNNMLDFSFFKCGPQLITSIFFIIKSYCYRIKPISSKDNLLLSHFKIWILFIIYILINFVINNGSVVFQNVMNCMILFIYIFTFYRLLLISEYIQKSDFERVINVLTSIILIFGFIQLIVIALDIPRNSIIKYLVYNDVYSSENIFYYKNHFRFYSTFMEPSYVAGLLVGLLCFYIFKKNKSKKDFRYSILINFAIILTFSSTAYILYACVILAYGLKNMKKKQTAFLFPLFIIMIIIIGYSTGIFDTVLFNKLSTKSGQVRTIWNNHAIGVFRENMLLGIGYKTLRASSIVYDILGELGIVGLCIYSFISLKNIKILIGKSSTSIVKIFSFAVIVMFIGQIIACPDLDLCSFWLVMYLFALSSKLKENSEGEIV